MSYCKLKDMKIKQILLNNPTVTSFEELVAILDMPLDDISEETRKRAEYFINRNRLRLQVALKQELYTKQDNKSREQLYKMICSEDELKRFGLKTADQNININPEITIKSSDPEMLDKLNNL